MLMDILGWLFFIIFIAGLLGLGGLLLRGYLTTGNATSGFSTGFFAPKPDKRLDVVDQANVDGRRRLVLVRRDDVEHLIMTGGPVDVVIETGIKGTAARRPEPAEAPATVYTRPARTISQAAGGQAAGGQAAGE